MNARKMQNKKRKKTRGKKRNVENLHYRFLMSSRVRLNASGARECQQQQQENVSHFQKKMKVERVLASSFFSAMAHTTHSAEQQQRRGKIDC